MQSTLLELLQKDSVFPIINGKNKEQKQPLPSK